MTDPYIHHITLTTGHARHSPRAEVHDDALAIIAPWLAEAIAANRPVPLPALGLEQYTAIAIVEVGLVVTVYAPGGVLPLVTFGVAQRSRQGGPLWDTLTEHFPAAAGLGKPDEPWCAVAVHPGIIACPGAQEWLGDFERCVAWAWITRNPQMEAV